MFFEDIYRSQHGTCQSVPSIVHLLWPDGENTGVKPDVRKEKSLAHLILKPTQQIMDHCKIDRHELLPKFFVDVESVQRLK